MKVSQSVFLGVPLIRVEGEVDHSCGADLQAVVRDTVDMGAERILMDLESCAYLDSAGLSVLLRLVEHLGARGWVGVVTLRLFDLAGLTARPGFRVFASLDDVRSTLSGCE
jgi:anti-anti-sigma factor